MIAIRAVLKRNAERALTTDGARRVFARRRRGKVLILAYHGIIPDGEKAAGEPALFVTRREFAAQLDELKREGLVVPLAQIDQHTEDAPRIAITFDDAYEGAVRYGVEELAKRKLPATIFVAPGRLNRHVFWWDALSRGAVVEESLRSFALGSLAGLDESVRAWMADNNVPYTSALPRYACTATHAELREAVNHPGITVASHTWLHPNLVSLSPAATITELVRSREWLETEFGDKAIPWLAYPYGLDSPRLHRAAASASYEGAVRISGGWHRPHDVSPFARPRLNIPAGLSLAGFRARINGAVLS